MIHEMGMKVLKKYFKKNYIFFKNCNFLGICPDDPKFITYT